MSTALERTIVRLSARLAASTAAIHWAAATIEETACTCASRSRGHQRDCVGVSLANEALERAGLRRRRKGGRS